MSSDDKTPDEVLVPVELLKRLRDEWGPHVSPEATVAKVTAFIPKLKPRIVDRAALVERLRDDKPTPIAWYRLPGADPARANDIAAIVESVLGYVPLDQRYAIAVLVLEWIEVHP